MTLQNINYIHTQRHVITDHFIGPQHPFLGLHPQRCHTLLKRSNWQQKAIMEGDHYLYVSHAFQAKGRVKGYCVNHWHIAQKTFVNQTFVTDLGLALVLANSAAQGLRMRRSMPRAA
ncbi:hypothetical protein L1F30_12175 [Simiduia sp. 21SJ11W-1]|uniref:hypothetical protein n=1 Tax=Simiduia sp. 21SJ11W-1 TaxID=2909669 RepID=UPI00209F766E|nr:hypothetical protein [Simiduia sp. 21SJ11W-1]UTA46917.1 hypothetical protein L1F30_12175 [Simiduia sp. 21SJ11W-1]